MNGHGYPGDGDELAARDNEADQHAVGGSWSGPELGEPHDPADRVADGDRGGDVAPRSRLWRARHNHHPGGEQAAHDVDGQPLTPHQRTHL